MTASAGCEVENTAAQPPGVAATAAAMAFRPAASQPSSACATMTRPSTRGARRHEIGRHLTGQLLLQPRAPCVPSVLFSLCSRSMAGASSTGDTESTRLVAASASRHSRSWASARPPQRNSTRVPPLNFSQPVTLMRPMPPVRATCVPPHADRS